MGSSHPDVYDFAGDYNLNGIILQAHDGTGGRFGEGGVNIQSLVQELNIYEGITQAAIYGTLVLVDSVNLITNKPQKSEIIKFNPKSVLNLSEEQLFKKLGKSNFIKHEGKLKNHQYYFPNCFVDIFAIKKEGKYLVDLFQRRPIKLNGFLNEPPPNSEIMSRHGDRYCIFYSTDSWKCYHHCISILKWVYREYTKFHYCGSGLCRFR